MYLPSYGNKCFVPLNIKNKGTLYIKINFVPHREYSVLALERPVVELYAGE
jgi:hypothetical protein